MPDIWRTGRKVWRTIYAQAGPDPSDSDPLIGVMDTPQLAEEGVAAVNASRLSADHDFDLDALEAALVTAADYIQTQMDARPASQCPRMRATDHAVLLAAIRRAVTTYLDQTDHRETEALATELATERTLHQQTLATLARVRADLPSGRPYRPPVDRHIDPGDGRCREDGQPWPCTWRQDYERTKEDL